jgi:hypothetical protein
VYLPQNACADDESQCERHGPTIRFPFRLNTQQDDCGYRGCTLSFIDRKHMVLELPISVKLFVKHIDYKYQVIQLYDPDNCFLKQLRWLNLSSFPFQFKHWRPKFFDVYLPQYFFFPSAFPYNRSLIFCENALLYFLQFFVSADYSHLSLFFISHVWRSRWPGLFVFFFDLSRLPEQSPVPSKSVSSPTLLVFHYIVVFYYTFYLSRSLHFT